MGDFLNILLKILLAFVFGGLIGFERERRNRPAGLRTHILVSVGSASFTISSIYFYKLFGTANDPSRVAANIVVGIGFLGAGTIIKEGFSVKGLTTAATIWVSAAIGLSCGLGLYLLAFLVSLLTFLTLILLRNFEIETFGKKDRKKRILMVKVTDEPGQLGKIGTILGEHGINIENVKFERGETYLNIILYISVPKDLKIDELVGNLSEENWILEVNVE
ncbi:MAG: MgtC/SapB family protein [Caldisericia bacterium]|nr:MgtC/SapB family protein [Caldisericia bacterium]